MVSKKSLTIWVVVICAYFAVSLSLHGGAPVVVPGKHGTVVKRDERMSVLMAEFGEISAVKVSDGEDGFYHLQFITMEPNSLFLPVHLHSDMVFYVESGSGTLSWVDLEKDEDKVRQVELRTGDVYRLRTGSFFYLQSNLESERRKLRINAIFSDSREEIREGSSYGAYSSVRDLVLGFDNKVLQAALNVNEEAIIELRSGERQPMIVHGVRKVEELLDVHHRIMIAFFGRMKNGMVDGLIDVNKLDKKNKNKAYNIMEAKHDVENCNGWSLVVTRKQLDALKDSDFGFFMVNLTKGAMMGPHWNPLTAEIAVVLRGRGMIHVVCPGTADETECKNSRFRVEEGDVFVVPRYHPMAQISFNNGSFVFMGFTTTQKNNHPQYLVGTASVFQVLDKNVLAASLGVSNTTMDQILSSRREGIILECVSCAEEEERLMVEEIQKEEEAARKREEEEARKKEEEEAKRKEEEIKRKEEEEEAKRQEEEAKREQEEARKKEEEEAKAREEEKRRQEEEEAARKKREEEEAARKQQQEQEAKRWQEEEAARRQQEEEEAARQEKEAAARRRQEEEAARQRQQEEAARQEQQEEAARQEQQRKQEEEAARQEEATRQEQQRKQEQEAARQEQQRQQEEAAKQEEEASRQEQQRQQEDAARRLQQQQEEAARRKQQEDE